MRVARRPSCLGEKLHKCPEMQSRVKRPLNNQHDPQEMIDAMIDVITAASNRYRAITPDSAAEMVRREQADEWGVIV